jgi:hypothetical protein
MVMPPKTWHELPVKVPSPSGTERVISSPYLGKDITIASSLGCQFTSTLLCGLFGHQAFDDLLGCGFTRE